MFFFNNSNKNYAYNNENCCNTSECFETLQNVRKDIIGELDAIIQYDNHLHSTNVEVAKATWRNIRDEELTHVGELLGLMFYLAPYQKEFVEKGLQEFYDRLEKE